MSQPWKKKRFSVRLSSPTLLTVIYLPRVRVRLRPNTLRMNWLTMNRHTSLLTFPLISIRGTASVISRVRADRRPSIFL